jgi:hypothetical integral membrane protein (TIGR02206 family)
VNFDYFFSSPGATPPELAFGQFTPAHLGMLGVMVGIIVALVWVYRVASIERRRVIRLVVGITVLTLELGIRQGGFLIKGIYTADILPLHACAATTFLVFIDSVKPNSWCREFIYALGTWGATCALIFPDWADQPLMNLFTWQSFSVHALLVGYALMILVAKEFRPSIRNLWKAVIIMVGFVVPSLLANHFLGTNFWFLATAAPGSPLEPLQGFAGNLYIPLLLGLLIVLWAMMYVPWHIRKHDCLTG